MAKEPGSGVSSDECNVMRLFSVTPTKNNDTLTIESTTHHNATSVLDRKDIRAQILQILTLTSLPPTPQDRLIPSFFIHASCLTALN